MAKVPPSQEAKRLSKANKQKLDSQVSKADKECVSKMLEAMTAGYSWVPCGYISNHLQKDLEEKGYKVIYDYEGYRNGYEVSWHDKLDD